MTTDYLHAKAVLFSVATGDLTRGEVMTLLLENASFRCSMCGADGAFHWVGTPTLDPEHPTMLCNDCLEKWKGDVKLMLEEQP